MFIKKYGPWAVIVGGSEGVGASFASQLAEQGMNLFLIARKRDPLEKLAETIRQKHNVEVRCLSVDITASDMLPQVAQATVNIDVGLLIYNAGSVNPKSFLDSSLEAAVNTVELNPMGQVKLSYHFGHRMRARGHGGMIFIGSVAGVAGGAGSSVYSAAKAFTQIFSEALWAELKPDGIDVLGFILGTTRTPYLERSGLAMDDAADPDDVARQALARIADGPIHLPEHLTQQFKELTSMDRRAAAEAMSAGVAAVTGSAVVPSTTA